MLLARREPISLSFPQDRVVMLMLVPHVSVVLFSFLFYILPQEAKPSYERH